MPEAVKKQLTDEETAKVQGGFNNEWVPYDDPHFPIECPKCRSRNIYYFKGLFGIREFNKYECRDCNYEFDDDEVPGGASSDW